ncbi:MAG: DUF1573 domain-containing protein [Planctomycetota bacterium]
MTTLSTRSTRSTLALALLLAACGTEPAEHGSIAGAPAQEADAAQGPMRLFCAAPVHDFGAVWEGVVVEHRFELEVRGEGELALQAAKPSCGCTVAELSVAGGEPYVWGTPLTAGDRLLLDTVFTSQNRVGAQDKSIVFYGNLAGDGRFEVRLKGEVGPYLIADPEVLEFGQLLSSDERIATAKVRSADGSPVRLAMPSLPLPPEGLTTEVHPVENAPEGPSVEWIVGVRVSPGGKVGSFRWPLRIETRDPDGQLSGVGTTVYARWNRVLPVASLPHVLSLGRVGPQTPASARVQLISNSPEVELGTLDLEGAVLVLDETALELETAFEIRVVDEGDGRQLELTTSGLPPEFRGRILGHVRVPVGVEGQDSLEIAIDGVALGGF